MLLKSETYQAQQKLASYCRDGKDVEIKGITPNRIHTYRRLVFNVALDTLESAFPIARKYIDAAIFEEMVSLFFEEHSNKSPLLWKMPLAFYQYALEKKLSEKYHLPYLNDLLWFEWTEVELFMMEDKSYPKVKEEGDVFEDLLVINPEFLLTKLEYPIHMMVPDKSTKQKGSYFLLNYREKESGKVQFINLSILFAYIIERISGGDTLKEMTEDILYLFGINDLDLLKNNIITFIDDLKTRGFVLGFTAHKN